MQEQNPFAQQNPYAAPTAPFVAQVAPSDGGIWRDGNTLIMQKQAVLPDICVKSNQETSGYRLKRSLSWHHPVLYAVLLVSLPIYAILAIVISKKATVYIGLSDEWRRKRLTRILIAWLCVLLSIGAFFGGIAIADGGNESLGVPMLLGSVFLFFAGILYGVIGARMIRTKHIDDRFVRFTGAHPAFLDRFPQFGMAPIPTKPQMAI